ncbi:hypothetical protein OG982_19120 [Streptomyces sp. NBC_01551]|nr:hypothetical protein [Streptomyces sp. NBC_01551]MCX4527766.1 hypothetical protein [Streptomyces sp. NBC_01551]
MSQDQWKPTGYRRRTERVGTVIVAVAGALLAAGGLLMGSVLVALASAN